MIVRRVEWSPRKYCCWWVIFRLEFQRKSSLESEDDFRFRWKLILNTTSGMAVKTKNSPSQHYNQPEDQTPSRLCPSLLQTICKTVCRHRRCADVLVPLWKNLHSLTKCLTSTKKQALRWRLSWQLKEKKRVAVILVGAALSFFSWVSRKAFTPLLVGCTSFYCQ